MHTPSPRRVAFDSLPCLEDLDRMPTNIYTARRPLTEQEILDEEPTQLYGLPVHEIRPGASHTTEDETAPQIPAAIRERKAGDTIPRPPPPLMDRAKSMPFSPLLDLMRHPAAPCLCPSAAKEMSWAPYLFGLLVTLGLLVSIAAVYSLGA